jgi:2-amino-4-hydroxy-6-hydroxymethyldihydropteridine diphosphokinase
MFLNAALALETDLTPLRLLASLLEIERALGRVRRERWGPRTIDLDILWIKDTVVESAELRVPHPELRRRAFALGPLLDVQPEAIDPRDGAAYRDIFPVLAAEARLSVRGERSSWAPMDMLPSRW